MRRSKEELELLAHKEQQFQEAQKHYDEYGDKRSWDEMFDRIFDCCFNICKQRLAGLGLSNERIRDTALDAAIYAQKMIINKGHHPRKLSSYCWMYCTSIILKPSTKWEDKHLRYFSYYAEEEEDEILFKGSYDSFEDDLIERLTDEGW